MKTLRNARSRRGNVLIEFAVAATFLTTVFTGIYQVGYSLYIYNELMSAVRAGTRYASLAKISNSGNREVPAAYQTAVQNMVVYGTAAPTSESRPLVPGLSADKVTVDLGFVPGNIVPQTVSVGVSNYPIDAVFKTINVSGKPVLTLPYFGQYCSAGAGC